MKKFLLLAVATLLMVLGAQVASASAANTLVRVGAFAEQGTDGELHHQGRIAVNYDTGDVYVADQQNDRVSVYRQNGTGADLLTSFGGGALTDPYGIAIDQDNGTVYVSDAGGVTKYDSDNAATPAFTVDAGFAAITATGPLAFDQSANELLLADTGANIVRRYSAAGVAVPGATFNGTGSPDTFGTGSTFTLLQDLAVDSTGDVIVIDAASDPGAGGTSRIERFNAAGTWEATIGPVDQAATVGVIPFNDDVIVGGNQDSVDANQFPTLLRFASDGTDLGPLSFDGPVQYGTTSGIAADDGPTGRLSVATDVSAGAGNYAGQYGLVSVQSYDWIPAATVTTVPTTDIGAFSATLRGTVNPEGADTTYHFEISSDGGASWSGVDPDADGDESAGSGTTDVNVDQAMTGLTENTEYRVRLLAQRGPAPSRSSVETFTTADAPDPSVAVAPPSPLGATTATLNGTINPLGNPATYHFEYRRVGDADWTKAPEADQDAGSGVAAVAVHAELSDLLALHDYEFRLVATGAGGNATTPVETFSTTASVPTVLTRQATQRTTTGARLQANVDPHFQSTTHYFEYGTDASYGSVSPAQPAYTGSTTLQGVSRTIDGLQPGVTYHYRVVATNATGTSYGVDRTVTTLAAPPVARAYEQVTPVSKNGVDLRSGRAGERHFPVAASGNAIGYVTGGSYGDAPTSLLYSFYRAERSSDAWLSTSLEIGNHNKHDFAGGTWSLSTLSMSDDLSHSVVSSRLALAPGAVEDDINFYLRDSASGALQHMFTITRQPSHWPIGTSLLTGNKDFSHVIFVADQALTPDAPDNGLDKLYEFTGGQLRLASIMPDGTPAAEGVSYGGSVSLKHMISRDGSRLFFSLGPQFVPGGAGVFMREHGQTTAISVSQRTGDGPEVRSGPVHDASADGSVVYFSSKVPLTDASPSAPTSVEAILLYRYDVAAAALTFIADVPDPGITTINPVLAVSADGERVYFESGGVQVWHAGQRRLVAELTGPGSTTIPGGPGFGGGGVADDTNFRLSPDGRLALFTRWVKTPDFDNVNPVACASVVNQTRNPGNQCQKLYFFDPDVDGVRCISCVSGGKAAGDAQLSQGDGRSITNDGRVFFNSPDRLVPGDVNSKYDAYQWHDGELSLLSAGTGDDDSLFINASDDGRDVFFATRDQLVGQDSDNVRDIYDAREGGGLLGQARTTASPPCEGDDCQPAGGSKPVAASIGTLTFTGAGSGADEALVSVSRSKVSVLAPKAVKGSRGALRVKVPGKGRVTVSGSGIATVTRSVSKAATVSITVSLTAKARSALKKRHRFTTTLRAVFKPSAGSASTAKVTLTFKAATAKKGR